MTNECGQEVMEIMQIEQWRECVNLFLKDIFQHDLFDALDVAAL